MRLRIAEIRSGKNITPPMVIINRKDNHVHECVSNTRASTIVGVSRGTIIRWQKARMEDGTYLEVYNNFELYFYTTTQKKLPSGKPFGKNS